MHRALRSLALPVMRQAPRSMMLPTSVFPAGRYMGMRYYASEQKPEEDAAEKKTGQTETDEPAEPVEQETEEAKLSAALAKKDKDLAELKNHYARAIADFRNLQELTKREVQKARDFALQKFARELLESLDNFELALGAVKPETIESNAEVKNLHDGVNMTKQVFEKTLARFGIEKVDPQGQEFDPNTHEATFQMVVPDKETGTVFHVQSPGYTLNGRVLRPAKVGVVKAADE